ncbi:MAG: hypoxanthine phosphoribosyltransferase [Muribaculaceae bacterium]|nr:hypoxanthine phosphoribosyltransferase [Muribaculaceae bacterium]
MEIVQVLDKKFSLYISKEQIRERVKEVAAEIEKDLKDKNPLFLVILNGSFVFGADLLREMNFPCEITFIRMSSYEGTSTTGEVKQVIGLRESIEGRTVVVVEDIIDTGYTMKEMLRILTEKNPEDIYVTSLFVKPDNLKVDVKIDYRCFDIDNDFIVGYGLDYDHYGRNLPDIYKVVE